jgi:hypothetical protein
MGPSAALAFGAATARRRERVTAAYDAAFINGIAWNLLILAIATTLLLRVRCPGGRPVLT